MNNNKYNLEKRHRNGNPSQMSNQKQKESEKTDPNLVVEWHKRERDYEMIQPDPCWVDGDSSGS